MTGIHPERVAADHCMSIRNAILVSFNIFPVQIHSPFFIEDAVRQQVLLSSGYIAELKR